ncbi:MAG: 23S rRNA (guanosine(2251)-2'-O)-methyltransferase RlmB [Bacilli bacterium]|nr:23S rRNA (guanosine(2251)-2'-O)-methyltransferase RlmB [Bacilli bacterium]
MKVFGKNVFNELKSNTTQIRKVYLSPSFKDKEIIDFIKKNNISYVNLDRKAFDRLSEGNTQGIILEVDDYKYKILKEVDLSQKRIVILDHLEDPHNFGAIIRTCEASGVKTIIIPKDRSVNVNPTVVKTSTGALEYVDIVEVSNLRNAIDYLKKNDYFVYGAEADGRLYDEVSYSDKMVLVIGSEGNGISRVVREACDEIISIPMRGHVNSLNASVSFGVLIYGIKN